jgi:CRISPR-associated protein (TIGR03986 family)
MTIVKSPYNFVPAPTEAQVFTPDWADKVSHDVPFEDGESGEIEIEITAETPIFIRNGHAKPEENEKPTAEFSHYIYSNGQKQYFIPATSLKGMVRNVLEIMSFSRLNKDLINDHRYAFRDLSGSTNQYMTRYKAFEIKAGWMFEDKEGNWKIEKCEDLAFIEHIELKESFGLPFRDYYLNKDPNGKNAKDKYEDRKVKEISLTSTFSKFQKRISEDSPITLKMAKKDPVGHNGRLVFTGQPSKRKEDLRDIDPAHKFRSSGKTREFVFFDDPNPKELDVNKDQQKDFKFIYGHDDPNNLSPDWKYWREKLKKGEKIPVFFSEDNSGILQHFGLSYMYKLPFKYKISHLEPLKTYSKSRDLTETLFGYAEKEDAFKGRVMFGHGLAEKSSVKELKTVDAILGGPKASYFPYYLTQFQKDGKHFTYDDLNAVLRGFKRYPVKNKEEKSLIGDNTKVISHFNPLDKGAKFKLKVRFHNLKQAEIGALLSAITFHGYSDQFYHSLGAAKPLGYGKVNVTVKDLKFLNKTAQEYMLDFETLMTSIDPDWLRSPQINELFAMAKGGVNEDFLQYPTVQEYADYKKKKVNYVEKELDKLDNFTETFEIQDLSKKIKPLALRLKPQNSLQLEDFDNYPDLSKYLNEEIEIFGDFTDANKKLIFDKIVLIIEGKHKDSIRKLRKDSHWEGNITKWLGQKEMNNLRTLLTPLL